MAEIQRGVDMGHETVSSCNTNTSILATNRVQSAQCRQRVEIEDALRSMYDEREESSPRSP